MFNKLDILSPFRECGPESFDAEIYRNHLQKYIINIDCPKVSYQVVILAAGKGARMSLDYPKVLYKLNYPGGKSSILENTIKMVNCLRGSIEISQVHLIIDEKSRGYYKNQDFLNLINIICLDDSEIQGTAICIRAIKKILDVNKDVIFIWGDLALGRLSDIDLAIKCQALTNSTIAFPTRLISSPYVAFLRNLEGKFIKVVHSNETERWSGMAEQDCLSFVCKYDSLLRLDDFINEFLNNQKSHQIEVDFIHFLPYLASKGFDVIGIPIVQPGLLYGLNTYARAMQINKVLGNYSEIEYEEYFIRMLNAV